MRGVPALGLSRHHAYAIGYRQEWHPGSTEDVMQGPPPTCTNPPQPSPPAGRAWYMFVCNPQQENHAANKLLEQRYEGFLPLFTQSAKTAGG